MPRKIEETKEIKKENIEKAVKKTNSTAKTTKKATKKTTTKSKKATTPKNKNVKKATTKSSTKKTSKTIVKTNTVEYYDLPYNYNKTVVKILAQTPKTLFVYWEISDEDREKFKKQYGENFFETTKPILIVHNDTLNYTFEVEINDFANSWYLHVNDSKSDYRIELGRRPISPNNTIKNDYIYVSESNEIESPNDHILFDKSQGMVYFRNVKTNVESKKDISNLTFIKNIGKIYNIYDLYKKIYKEENIEDIYSSNPSSNFNN